MGRSLSFAIDSLIEKKINESRSVNTNRVSDLYRYSQYLPGVKKEIHKYCFQYSKVMDSKSVDPRIDTYNNKFYTFYDNKVKKTPCRFNLLRMFKPGELLTSITNH